MQILLILALVLALATVIFAVQNAMPVTVGFLVWQFVNAPLALVLLLAVALGVLISLFLSLPSMIASRWTVSRLKKRVAELEKTAQDQQTRAATLEATLAEVRAQLATPAAKPPADSAAAARGQ